MSNAPVVSVTDELISELDEACLEHKLGFMIEASEVRALLSEREELKRDAARYRWLRDNWFQIYGESKGRDGIRISIGDIWNHAGVPAHVDAAIDAAMQS